VQRNFTFINCVLATKMQIISGLTLYEDQHILVQVCTKRFC